MEEKNIKRNIPRDLFLHLLAIVTLYWTAVTFVTLMWQYINYFFPDVLNFMYYNSMNGLIRFAVSSLIIVFPIFLAVSWYLNKIYSRESAVRESKIRKWLIYLTLFIASLVIIGDLVSVINTFLGGEIKARFFLKALSILVVAIVIFWYYLDDVRREAPTKLARPFAWGTGAVILASVIGAFFIVGTPQAARLMEFDQQKIQDLQTVQSQIVSYWQRKEALPPSLEALNDPLSGYMTPNDPQSNQPYEYKIINADSLSFELCANFNKEGNDIYGPARSDVPFTKEVQENWQHPAGRHCFVRTIDKQLYPPLNKQ